MGRYTEAKCRLCRRAGMKLFLKGGRCDTEKCALARRPTPPGMHGAKRSNKPSYYSLQLNEKQKVKRIYGMLERQFKRFFSVASRSRGATGGVLLQLLERRLDNVIFRALFAFSRNQARQMVQHGFVFVNGKRVSIPSCWVKEEQIIEIRAKDSLKKSVQGTIETNKKRLSVPSWLLTDEEALTIKIVRLPVKEDLSIHVDEQLIVELYSK